jgi:hypothetical protein
MNTLRRMFVISLAAIGALASVAFAEDANITGTWAMSVESPAGTGSPKFTLKQSGTEVTGTYQGALGEAPVTGTVKGKDVMLEFTASGMNVKYFGTVEGDTMKGKVSLGDFGEGTFTGKKS